MSLFCQSGNYGLKGSEKFKDLAKERGVCVAVTDNVASSDDDKAFDEVCLSRLCHLG